MKKLIKPLLILLTLFTAARARAFVIDTNLFYLSDSITADENSSHAATYFDILVGFDIDKKGMYQIGWNYSSHSSTTENNGNEVTFKTSTEMGPGFVVYMNKKRTLRFGFAYNYKMIADYEANGGAKAEWRGTSMLANFGYQIRWDGITSLGIRLNYVSITADESVNTSNTKQDVSHKKSILYPSIALTLDSF